MTQEQIDAFKQIINGELLEQRAVLRDARQGAEFLAALRKFNSMSSLAVSSFANLDRLLIA